MADTLKGRRKRGAPPKKSMAPGGGGRFAALSAKLAGEGAEDPDAEAAAIGRKKYGAKKMAAFSAAGRKRAS